MLIRVAKMAFDDDDDVDDDDDDNDNDDDDDEDDDSYENSVWYNVEEAKDENDSNTYITMMPRNETRKNDRSFNASAQCNDDDDDNDDANKDSFQEVDKL